MHMILYISDLNSQLCGVGAPPNLADVSQILNSIQQQAEAFNASLDITGVLFFWDGSFFQVLEGAESAVKQLFRRIEKDPRHCHVRCLIDQRCFSSWRMRCINLNADQVFDKTELIEMLQAYRETFKPTSKSLLSVIRHTLPISGVSP